MDEVKIQLRFSKDGLNDALYLTLNEWESLSKEEIEVMKQERVDAWKKSVEEASQPAEKSPEDLLAEKEAIEQQIAELQQQKVELETILAPEDNTKESEVKLEE